MIPNDEVGRTERVPRADKLNLLRDIVHLLKDSGGITGKRTMLYKAKEEVGELFLVESTFTDYLMIGSKLGLMNFTGSALKMLEKGVKLTDASSFGDIELSDAEKRLFRMFLLSYSPFRAFLTLGFCDGRAFISENQLYECAVCPTRNELLDAYIKAKEQTTDREARTLLGWGLQIGLVEHDEYSQRYYLVREQKIEPKSFLKALRNVYLEIFDPRTKIALIPKVRFQFCCSTNVSGSYFDEYILKLYETQPLQVRLGKGSASRENVRKFGTKDKASYYYYIDVRAGE